MKSTIKIAGRQLDIVMWILRVLLAIISFFTVQLYRQVQTMDADMDDLKSDAKVMRQAMRDHGIPVERSERKK